MPPRTTSYTLPANLRLRHITAMLAFVGAGLAVLSATATSQEQAKPPSAPPTAVILAPPAPGSFAVAEAPTGDCTERLANFLAPLSIDFSFASSFVDARHAPLLAQISEEIARCPGARVTIAGHADGSGSDLANATLSWERADHTLNLLVSLGAPAGAMTARGLGASSPLAQGSDDESAADRRVEFIVAPAAP